jgi:FKBP-type peptidyl-prolyl cis-trans isomerase
VYEGRFLNSSKFDDSGPKGQPFTYVRGQQWQVVAGLEKALAGMSEGEKATFIMPSKLAFGVKGLADIVPPFTPVIYEVEVKRVDKY